MEITSEQLWTLAQMAGAAAASFATTWAALVRPLNKRVAENTEAISPEQLSAWRSSVEEHGKELARLVQCMEQAQSDCNKLAQRIEKLEEKGSRMVTDDEFQTYTSTTTQSLQNLIEKLGHVTGQFEAWTRAQSGR